MASSTRWLALTDLDLRNNELGPAGVEALAQRAGLSRRARLGVSGNELRTEIWQDWTDWDGSVIGGEYVPLPLWQIAERYFAGQEIELH